MYEDFRSPITTKLIQYADKLNRHSEKVTSEELEDMVWLTKASYQKGEYDLVVYVWHKSMISVSNSMFLHRNLHSEIINSNRIIQQRQKELASSSEN